MSDQIEIVGLSEVEDTARTRFYERVFPDRARVLGQHWRWFYRVGFRNTVEPQVAVVGGVVIGQAGVIPALLHVAGSVQQAQWYVDFAVLPEYQGKGVGQRLTTAWMQLGQTFITHCNDNSMRVFRKFGFAEHDETIRYACPIHPGKMLARHSFPVRVGAAILDPLPWAWARAISRRAPRLDPISIDRAASTLFGNVSTAGSGLVRDEDWARWRLRESPVRHQYTSFSIDDAHAIVRRFDHGGVRRIHLLWLIGEDPDARRELMCGLTKWSLEAGCDLIWAATNSADLGASMRTVLPFRKPFRFAFFSHDSTIFAQLRRAPLAVQAIDSDTDSMYA